MVKLKQLIKDIEGITVKGSKEVEISGLSSHSKKVAPGDLFFAKKGTKSHGLDFAKDAFLAGAKAIVTDLYNPFFKEKTQIIVEDVLRIEPLLAKRFYLDPSKDLFMVGITGTNGKTTTSFIVQSLLSSKQSGCGLIGTIEINTGKNRIPSNLTTPDVLTLNKYLKEMVSFGYKNCSMEVSSHALDQNRVEGIDFDHVIFTNLTQDHLDYHGTFENYLKAKQKLFQQGRYKKQTQATVNIDCPYAKEMMQGLPTATVSLTDPSATFYVSAYELCQDHTKITLQAFGKKYSLSYPLIGKFNIYNVVEAISCAYHAGISMNEIEKKLKNLPGVPGRMQMIKKGNFPVFIDFAHTEDALLQVLMTLKSLQFKKIILVFGCGGDRDQDKRAKMGKVASQHADYSIITSDNPRSENPESITEMIVSGMVNEHKKIVILDRKEAIFKAISLAKENECVVITGKGHENYQIFNNKTIEFSDFETVLSYFQSQG